MLSQMTGFLNALQALTGGDKSGGGRTGSAGFEEVLLSLETESAAADAEAGEGAGQRSDATANAEGAADLGETDPKPAEIEIDGQDLPESVFSERDNVSQDLAVSDTPEPAERRDEDQVKDKALFPVAGEVDTESVPDKASAREMIPPVEKEPKPEIMARYSSHTHKAGKQDTGRHGRPVNPEPAGIPIESPAAGKPRARNTESVPAANKNIVTARPDPKSGSPARALSGNSGSTELAQTRQSSESTSPPEPVSVRKDSQVFRRLPEVGKARGHKSADAVRESIPAADTLTLEGNKTPAAAESRSAPRGITPGNHADASEYSRSEIRYPDSRMDRRGGVPTVPPKGEGPAERAIARDVQGRPLFTALGQRHPDKREHAMPSKGFSLERVAENTGRSASGRAASPSKAVVQDPMRSPQSGWVRAGEKTAFPPQRDACVGVTRDAVPGVIRVLGERRAVPMASDPALSDLTDTRQPTAEVHRSATGENRSSPADWPIRQSLVSTPEPVAHRSPQAAPSERSGPVAGRRLIFAMSERPISDGSRHEPAIASSRAGWTLAKRADPVPLQQEPSALNRIERPGLVEAGVASQTRAEDRSRPRAEAPVPVAPAPREAEEPSRRRREISELRPAQTVMPDPISRHTTPENAKPPMGPSSTSVLSPVLDESAPLRGDIPLGVPAADAQLSPSPGATPAAAMSARYDGAQAIVRQLVEAVSGSANAADDTIELKLNPEELGHLRFRMVQGEHGLTLTINAERPETLDLLRRHVDQLARHLSDLGYDSASFSFGEERRGHQGRGAVPTGQTAMAETASPLPPAPLAASGGLDIRL